MGTALKELGTKAASSAAGKGAGKSWAWLCVFIMLVGTVLSWPYAEIGANDDWSTIRTAQLFAQTGHFHYNGWMATTLGWQVLLGALSIKVLGFSFTAARIPTMLLALATVYLLQRTLMLFNLEAKIAAFGALVVASSPIYFPLTTTFMTDVYGFLPYLPACMPAYAHCVRPENAKP